MYYTDGEIYKNIKEAKDPLGQISFFDEMIRIIDKEIKACEERIADLKECRKQIDKCFSGQ